MVLSYSTIYAAVAMVMMFTVVEAGLEIVKGIVGKIVRIDKVAICGLVTR